MRYLGSKVKLLEFIHRTIIKYNIIGNSFCDLFAGTASVSDYFKGQYEIIANDFMYYSYVFSKPHHNLKTTAIPYQSTRQGGVLSTKCTILYI
jgi:adenine-specific DNA methylase